MTELTRHHFHHPMADLPIPNVNKLAESQEIMEKTQFRAPFYYIPSQAKHIWLVDVFNSEDYLIEAMDFMNEMTTYYKNRAAALMRVMNLRGADSANAATGKVTPLR